MNEPFDAYYTWLGIPPAEQPPHFYRLLGVQLFESNLNAIEHAADRRMMHLCSFQTGAHAAESQHLLNQIATARVWLLDPAKKAQYDQQLRAHLPQQRPLLAQRPMPVPQLPVSVARPMPIQSPPQPVPQQVSLPESPPIAIQTDSAPRRKHSSGANASISLVKAVVGGAGGLAIGVLVLWIGFRSDPFGLFGSTPKTVAKAPETVASVAPVSPNAAPVVVATIPATKPADSQPAGATKSNSTHHAAAPVVDVRPQAASPTPAPSTPSAAVASNDSNNSADSVDNRPLRNRDLSDLINTSPEAPSPAVVVKKQPVPSTEAQKTKLAEIKGFYAAEFETSTRPANRESFIDFLITTASALRSDPVARYVLLREAYDRSAGLKDFVIGAELIDVLEAEYEVDTLRGRMHLLMLASSNAKTQVEKASIVLCALELADIARQQQRIADAQKLCRIAEAHAKNAGDKQLNARAAMLSEEIDKLAAEWGPVELARQTLLQQPNHVEASLIDGKYRCLSEGDWAKGLALLAQSSNEALRTVAATDLAGTTTAVSAMDLGDAWYVLAKDNRSLQDFYTRALHWYREAAKTETGLNRVKVDQRTSEIMTMSLAPRLVKPAAGNGSSLPSFVKMLHREEFRGPTNVFTFLNPAHLTGMGTWRASSNRLYSAQAGAYTRLQSSYVPPREYRLTLQVRRGSTTIASSSANGPLIVGLSNGRGQFAVVFDLPQPNGYVSFLSLAGAKNADLGKTAQQSSTQTLQSGFVVCEVRRNSVQISVNGTEVCRYEGDLAKLTVPKEWGSSDSKALFLGSHLTAFTVESWVVEPLPSSSISAAAGTSSP